MCMHLCKFGLHEKLATLLQEGWKDVQKSLHRREDMKQWQGLFSDLSYHNNYSSAITHAVEAWCVACVCSFCKGK